MSTTVHLYKNPFRWRVTPPIKAEEHGYFDQGFGSKLKAIAYQRKLQQLFPDNPTSLSDTGRYYDALGRTLASAH